MTIRGGSVDTAPDVEWTSSLQAVLANTDAVSDEPYRRPGYSVRPCPQCDQPTLVRHTLPRRFRLFRRLGFNLRQYHCESCDRRMVLRVK